MRAIRINRGISLAELGRRTQYSKSSWERWLNDRRPLHEDAVRRFAEACGVDVADLLSSWESECREQPVPAQSPDGAEPDQAAGDSARPRGRIRRFVLGAGLAAVIVGGVMIGLPAWHHTTRSPHLSAPAAHTVAAPGCRAAGCVDQDPQSAGCAGDARVIAVKNIQKVLVWLKYSPKCQAAWVKITDAGPPDTATITTGGQSETAVIHYGLDAYSHMVDASAGHALQACGEQPNGTGCTPVIPDAMSAPPVSVPGATPPSASATADTPTGSTAPTTPSAS